MARTLRLMPNRLLAPILLSLFVVAQCRADMASGPSEGAKVPAAKVFAVTGPHEGKELDYAADRGEKTTVYLYIKEFDRPVARFMKTLEAAVKAESAEAVVVAVWLTDDAEKTKTYLPRVQQSLKMEITPFAYFPDRNGPDNWSLNPNCRVTAVIAAKGKVFKSIGYGVVNDTDVPTLQEAVKKAVAAKG